MTKNSIDSVIVEEKEKDLKENEAQQDQQASSPEALSIDTPLKSSKDENDRSSSIQMASTSALISFSPSGSLVPHRIYQFYLTIALIAACAALTALTFVTAAALEFPKDLFPVEPTPSFPGISLVALFMKGLIHQLLLAALALLPAYAAHVIHIEYSSYMQYSAAARLGAFFCCLLSCSLWCPEVVSYFSIGFYHSDCINDYPSILCQSHFGGLILSFICLFCTFLLMLFQLAQFYILYRELSLIESSLWGNAGFCNQKSLLNQITFLAALLSTLAYLVRSFSYIDAYANNDQMINSFNSTNPSLAAYAFSVNMIMENPGFAYANSTYSIFNLTDIPYAPGLNIVQVSFLPSYVTAFAIGYAVYTSISANHFEQEIESLSSSNAAKAVRAADMVSAYAYQRFLHIVCVISLVGACLFEYSRSVAGDGDVAMGTGTASRDNRWAYGAWLAIIVGEVIMLLTMTVKTYLAKVNLARRIELNDNKSGVEYNGSKPLVQSWPLHILLVFFLVCVGFCNIIIQSHRSVDATAYSTQVPFLAAGAFLDFHSVYIPLIIYLVSCGEAEPSHFNKLFSATISVFIVLCIWFLDPLPAAYPMLQSSCQLQQGLGGSALPSQLCSTVRATVAFSLCIQLCMLVILVICIINISRRWEGENQGKEVASHLLIYGIICVAIGIFIWSMSILGALSKDRNVLYTVDMPSYDLITNNLSTEVHLIVLVCLVVCITHFIEPSPLSTTVTGINIALHSSGVDGIVLIGVFAIWPIFTYEILRSYIGLTPMYQFELANAGNSTRATSKEEDAASAGLGIEAIVLFLVVFLQFLKREGCIP